MSIRFKLVISYVCMILLPIALAILFLHLLFHLFVGNIEEMKDHYNVEKTFFAEVMNDDLPIYLNLQNHAKEEPELFRNDSFLAQYKEQLDKRKVILLVWEDEEMIYQSAFIDDHVFSELPSDEERNQQGALKVDSGAWVYTMNDFYFADGEKGSYILMLDVDPIDSFIRIVVPTLIILFLLAFLLANGVLTAIVSKHIITPIRELQKATNRIKDGDLQQPVTVKRNDEIGDLSNDFEEMRLRLKESVEKQAKYENNRKELMNNISHDLKTPITSIKGYVEGILDGVANDQDKLERYCKTIHAKAVHMDRLIDELQLFSKLDLNSVVFHFGKLEIVSFFKELLEEMKLDFEKQQIDVILDNRLDQEVFVKADRDKIERALRNIVSNSMKFLDKDRKEIIISIERINEYIQIVIKDNGKGIKEKDLPFVFDRFYRGDCSRNTESGGSGIGLAIVKQIMEAHGGTVSIESTYGFGTSFSIILDTWEESGDSHDENLNY